MNLLFRLITLCISYIFERRKIAPLDISELHFRVWPTDLDANIHMNNGRYLSIMDLGRLDLIVRMGIMKTVLKEKWMPVLSAATIRYHLPLHPFQKFSLQSRVIWWDEKWFYMEQRFIVSGGKTDGAVAAIAFVKGSFYRKRQRRTVPTSELMSLMGLTDADTPAQPSYIASWQTAENDMRDLTKEAL